MEEFGCLVLNNEVGKAYYTVEIPSQLNSLDDSTQIKEKVADPNIVQVEVRDIQGRIILQTRNYEDVERLAERNVYHNDNVCKQGKKYKKNM